MTGKSERSIYLFLSLHRFFAYGLAVMLVQGFGVSALPEPSLRTNILLGIVGVYTLLKVLGPLRWWRQDPSTYIVLGGDVLVALVILLLTGGLDSPYLLYSLAPVMSAALLFPERLALLAAAIFSVSLVVAHLTPAWWDSDYTWLFERNYLLWLVLYISAGFVISTIVYRTNLNIRQFIESEAVLEERRRIRREIHDGLGQTLTYLSLKAESVGAHIGKGHMAEAEAASAEVNELARELYQEVRESINQLNVEPLPLRAVLEDYAAEFTQRTGIAAKFEGPPEAPQLSPSVEFQLVRIVQEALTNVRKHAHATRAWVGLQDTNGKVEVSIRDNGEGFTESAGGGEGVGHHGMKNMHERAEALGGTLSVTTTPGQGTIIRVGVPRSRWRN
jgi:glucose-6-phosphate-specific signal transduction histidine kinase